METTIKVTVYNGATKLKFAYTEKENNINIETAKDYIYNSLAKVLEQQGKLKALGAKNNFFGLSSHNANYIDIDIVTENETQTFLSGLTFKFSQFNKVDDKREAFNIIFDTQIFLNKNGLVIE
jgi:hypothetical protein